MKQLNGLENFIASSPGLILIKDKNSAWQTCTTALKNMMGFSSKNPVKGILDNELNCPASELANYFVKQDRVVLESKQSIKTLHLLRVSGGHWQALLADKHYLTANAQEPEGTITYFIDVTKVSKINLGHLVFGNSKIYSKGKLNLLQQTYIIDGLSRNIHLSARQEECLFFLSCGKTIKEIAKYLSLSPRTIEYYIEQLKHRLNCHSKTELIEFTESHNFLPSIPESLLTYL